MLKAHRLVYHSTLGSRGIKKKTMPRTRARRRDECSRPGGSLQRTRGGDVHPPSPMMRTRRRAAAPAGGSTAWRPL